MFYLHFGDVNDVGKVRNKFENYEMSVMHCDKQVTTEFVGCLTFN
jgi:hypothetical protein